MIINRTCFLIFIFIVILGPSQVSSFIQKESFYSQGPEIACGIWSDKITAVHDQWNQPAQHFLCGYAVRQMKWTKLLNNCKCKTLFNYYKCQWCINTFWTMRDAFTAIYCETNNWKNQITKTFSTGNTQHRNWKKVICPEGFYVKQAAAQFSNQFQTMVGFTGMQLTCSNLEQNKEFKINDNSKQPFQFPSENSPGTFVTAVRVKYLKNGQLTGINWIFQGIPEMRIDSVEYDLIVGKPEGKTIERVKIANNGKSGQKVILDLTKNYPTTHRWTNKNPYFSSYMIRSGIEVKPPQLGFEKDQRLYTIVRQKQFSFDKPLINNYVPKSLLLETPGIILPVPPLSNITATTIINQLNVTLSYQMRVSFYDKTTGIFITETTIEGTYTGLAQSSTFISLQQEQCIGAWEKNFIPNGNFQINSCAAASCYWDEVSIKNNVPGWIPSPSIQIGRGSVYNPALGNTWVAQLDSNANSCIKQKIRLGSGRYLLRFDRIARIDTTLESNQMEVKIDGQLLRRIYPENYLPKRQEIELNFVENSKDYWFQFCGAGTSDRRGIVLDNMKMHIYNDCFSINTTKY